MRIRSVVVHAAQAIAEGGLIALLVVGLVAGTVLAAKGGGGKHGGSSGTSTITLVVMDGAPAAEFGGRVTFDVSTSATPYPYVHLRCSQGRTLVLESWQGFFPTALGDQWFYLGPTPSWSGGDADCTATLEKKTNKGWSVLGSTSFHVVG